MSGVALDRVRQRGRKQRRLALRSALSAKELGGSLSVRSGGLGQGAAFTLELPCPKRENAHE